MTGRYLLDTNIVIGLLEGDEAVRSRLSQAVEVFVPTIVLGELYFGARKSARWEENVARIDDFASRAAVLAPDTGSSRLAFANRVARFRRTTFGSLRPLSGTSSLSLREIPISNKLLHCLKSSGSL